MWESTTWQATPLSRYEFACLLAEGLRLDSSLICPVGSEEMNWTARRPRNSSLNVEKASDMLEYKPLEIQYALSILNKEIKVSSDMIR